MAANLGPVGTPGAAGAKTRTDDAGPLRRGGVLLVLATLACTVFAFLAGADVGNQDTMFLIAFVFLGLITVGIFALAWVDSTSRPDTPKTFH